MGVGLAALKTVNIYCASFFLIRISGAVNKLSREGVGVGVGGWLGIMKIKPTQPPVGASWGLG